jgi:hydroxymethylbilane synthase
MSFVLGTRGSDLALWQARWVAQRLGDDVRLEIVKTEGDRAFDADLSAQGDRGLFTRDIEEALLEGRVDAAVHSLKDLPTLQPEGLAIAAVPERAAPGDVLLVRPEAVAEDPRLPLKRGARVGTGSPRRIAQLFALRPDAVAGPFRGNVPTRVAKCVRGEVDAVILARAGLDRLGLDTGQLILFDLDPASWLPAPAQGALGIQSRADDDATKSRLAPLRHDESACAASIERELLRILEAGCHAALGAWARPAGSRWRLDAGLLADADADADGDNAGAGAAGGWRRVSLVGDPGALAAEAADLLQGDGATRGMREGCFTRRA